MAIGTGLGLLIGGLIGAGGSVAGSAIAGSAAKGAAKTQVEAADKASQLEREIYQQNRSDIAPWRTTGTAALQQLANLLGIGNLVSSDTTRPTPTGFAPGMVPREVAQIGPNGEIISGAPVSGLTPRQEELRASGIPDAMLPYADPDGYQQGNAPTIGTAQPIASGEPSPTEDWRITPGKPGGQFGYLASRYPGFEGTDLELDPGYQFRVSEGLKGVERSSAARTGTLSGAATKEMARFGQGLASDEFARAWGRGLQKYTTNFGVEEANKQNLFNRLSMLAGLGQQAATTGTQMGANLASNLASNITGAGNAAAAGQVGSANAWSTGIGSAASNIGNLVMLNSMLNRSSYVPPPTQADLDTAKQFPMFLP